MGMCFSMFCRTVDALMFIVVLKMLLFYLKKICWFLEVQKAEILTKYGSQNKSLVKYKDMRLIPRI